MKLTIMSFKTEADGEVLSRETKLVTELYVKEFHQFFVNYQTDGKRDGNIFTPLSNQNPRTLPQSLLISSSSHWKPEMVNITAQRAAVHNADLIERHVAALLIVDVQQRVCVSQHTLTHTFTV